MITKFCVDHPERACWRFAEKLLLLAALTSEHSAVQVTRVRPVKMG
jgi:hypothetical protein